MWMDKYHVTAVAKRLYWKCRHNGGDGIFIITPETLRPGMVQMADFGNDSIPMRNLHSLVVGSYWKFAVRRGYLSDLFYDWMEAGRDSRNNVPLGFNTGANLTDELNRRAL